MIGASLSTAVRALGFVPPDERDTWVRMGMALKAEFGDDAYSAWVDWSSAASSFDVKACEASWRSFKNGGKVGIGSLFDKAKASGFEFAADEVEVSPEELALRQKKREARDAKAEANRVKAAAAAAVRAASQFRTASKDGVSPYLERKKVHAESCRFLHDGAIIIPMIRYDAQPSALVGKQQINADGSKKFSSGMDKSGAMCRLGDAPTDGDVILVGEGYATGGSVRLALDFSVPFYICFDAGMLLAGAKILAALYPSSRIVFCADDDYLTGDVGVKKAQAAATAVGGSVFVPRFSAVRRSSKTDESFPYLTDCNDLHCAEGVDALRVQLRSFLSGSADAAVAVSPAPTLVNEAADGCVDMPEEEGDAPAGDALLLRFLLIFGSKEVWDSHKKRKFKWAAFEAYVGKREAKAWIDNPKKKIIQKEALPALIGGAAAQLGVGGVRLNEMLDNLTLLRGTETVWDMIGRQVMSLGAVRANYTPDLTSRWQEDPRRNTVEQKNLVFDPTQTVDLETHVNIFFGWPLVPKSNLDLVAPILELIESLCSSEDNHAEVFEFILSWMALPLQKPGAKMQTALLVFGEKQGTGKSLLFDSILRPIYGEYGTTVGQHQLESGFTDWRSRKLFTLFEEVLSRDDKFSHNGTLKYMITGKRMQVNPKNLPLREENNHMNCVFLSNEPQPIPIELEDRRFLVVQARHVRDQDFYQRVVTSIESGGLEAFYHFLLNYDLGDFNEHTKPPMTRAKERVIAFGRASWDAFHFSWKEGLLEAPYCSCLSSDLYIAYKRWCDRNGEKPLSLTKFAGLLDSREHKCKKEISLDGKPKKSYMIFEIVRPGEKLDLHGQCTHFRQQADTYGSGN